MRRWRRRTENTRNPEPGPDPGRAEDRNKEPHPESFASRVTGLSHVSVVLAPSTTVGPEPLHIPATGHNIYLDLAATGEQEVVLNGLRAEVLGRGPLEPDGVSLVPQPGPYLALAEDLDEARRRGLENYRPLLIPHFEVFLDENPPLVRTALEEHGRPARPESGLPLRVAVGETLRIVLAPVTDDRGLVDWRLTADVTCGGFSTSAHWDLRVTAETTMRTFHPGGSEPGFTPAHEIAPHWKPAFPPGDYSG